MIPIRRYPYTDFHDLNLDYLLRQIAEFEEDLEALKRRVTALEGWKVIIDGDITTIKGDILTIKGDIVNIKGDIVTIKGDIVDIKADIVDIQGDIVTINTTINKILKQEFCFLMRIPVTAWVPDTSYTEYPFKAVINFTDPTVVIEDYQKFVDQDWRTSPESEVRLEFVHMFDYMDHSTKICSYVETALNQITIYATEQINSPLDLYAYVMNKIYDI